MRLKPLNLLLAGVLITGVAACNREEPAAQNTAAQTSEARDDGWITTSVQAKYYADDDVRGRNLSVETQNGVVTVRGTVESEAARQRAITLAQEVEGVTRVDDQLRVDTAMADDMSRPAETDPAVGTSGAEPRAADPEADARRPDLRRTETAADAEMDARNPGWITTKIQAQYFVNPEVKPWNIDVTTANNGVVTLEGEVDSAEDKAEAVRIAQQTEGVTRVEDRLRIQADRDPAATGTTAPAKDPKPADDEAQRNQRPDQVERPDAWLTTKVQSKYFLDDEVKGRDIDVDTQNGVVTLNGTVNSEAEKRQAVALARNTEGVREVVDRLQIVPEAQRTEKRDPNNRPADTRTTGTTGIPEVDRPDVWITTKVQAKYFLDGDIKGRNIDVDTNNGVVTLKGTVQNDAEKRLAEQIAKDTEGVRQVQNQLTVGPAAADRR